MGWIHEKYFQQDIERIESTDNDFIKAKVGVSLGPLLVGVQLLYLKQACTSLSQTSHILRPASCLTEEEETKN